MHPIVSGFAKHCITIFTVVLTISICPLSSGHRPADLIDTGDPAEHLRQRRNTAYNRPSGRVLGKIHATPA